MKNQRHVQAVVLCALACVVCGRASAAERPNVLVILTDDQGWGDLSVNGNTNLSTPNVDSLVRDGALFEKFFVCPVCSPTRAEFLTGRYHPRCGVWSTSVGGERLDLDERTIGDIFKGAGYATAVFGKWHNGSQFPYHPNGRGFDEHYGFCSGHWGEYFTAPLERNGNPVHGRGYITDDITDRALDFIEKNSTRPFFCYVAFNAPHTPMQVPDLYFDRIKSQDIKLRHDDAQNENITMTRAALAMCENIDDNVGRLLQKLDDLNLERKTIVLYFCDNGPNSGRWNGGMKGKKGSTDEGGVRSPLFVRWPDEIRPGTRIPQIAAAIDLLPTLTELAGIPLAGTKSLDGVSLAPLLRDQAADWPERMIFSHWNGNVSVRTQQHRLDTAGRLYDMTSDPGQTRDISRDASELTARLSAAVDEWKRDTLAELKWGGEAERPFPVGYREFPVTVLPARDGTATGQVRRSGSAPNCSYFTNWGSPEDRIRWDVVIATTGRYEAVVYYTCAPENVGTSIELSLNSARLESRVTEAHDPPVRGSERDRVPRTSESYVKDFKPWRLGILPLKAGRGSLTLRAVEIPGRQAIEVRSVVLTLLE